MIQPESVTIYSITNLSGIRITDIDSLIVAALLELVHNKTCSYEDAIDLMQSLLNKKTRNCDFTKECKYLTIIRNLDECWIGAAGHEGITVEFSPEWGEPLKKVTFSCDELEEMGII